MKAQERMRKKVRATIRRLKSEGLQAKEIVARLNALNLKKPNGKRIDAVFVHNQASLMRREKPVVLKPERAEPELEVVRALMASNLKAESKVRALKIYLDA